ncbi:MAG: bifunctional helix-turn-helix transcriptional regulator/GNAT family N-acetyltransferase [bacterium]
MPLTANARIRRFNRAVTREAGALEQSFMGRGRPLGVARVLWGIPRHHGDIASVRSDLGLDSGLFSRILRSLQSEGLIALTAHPQDGRRRIACLTELGQSEVALYDQLNDSSAERILSRAPDSAALLAAMDLVATALNRDHVQIIETDPDSTAAQYCLQEYFTLLSQKIPGVTLDLFPLPDPKACSYRPPHGCFLIAWSDAMPLGCVSLRPLDGATAEVKRLWVAPDARGQGLARRLMLQIEDRAHALGYSRLNLDTNANLPEAIALYHKTGWTAIAAYSGFPSTHWFSKAL